MPLDYEGRENAFRTTLFSETNGLMYGGYHSVEKMISSTSTMCEFTLSAHKWLLAWTLIYI